MRRRIRRLIPAVATVAVLPAALSVWAAPAHAGDPVTCSFTVDDVSKPEGNAGTTTFTFTVTQHGFNTTATVPYSTTPGSAVQGADYLAASGTLTFGGANSQTKTVDVTVNGDTQVEPDEDFFLDISNDDSTCVMTKNRGTGTIQNEDVPPPVAAGYRLTALDGGVFAYGESTYEGSANTIDDLRAPIIDIDETPLRDGYWQVGIDGGVFAWDAPFFGSAARLPLNAPILGIAARPQGDGYWLVGLDGGVFAYGGAPFLGSKANDAEEDGLVIVDIVSTSTGQGYWLLDAYGQVFAFGDAKHLGDHEAADVEAIGLAATPDDTGYWIANWGGKVFQFGTAADHGDIEDPESLNGSIVAIEATEAGHGYWLAGFDGGVFAFGDAPFYGSAANLPLAAGVVGISGKR